MSRNPNGADKGDDDQQPWDAASSASSGTSTARSASSYHSRTRLSGRNYQQTRQQQKQQPPPPPPNAPTRQNAQQSRQPQAQTQQQPTYSQTYPHPHSHSQAGASQYHQPRQRNRLEHHSNMVMHHQPHGVSAIGPSPSTVSTGTSISQQHHAVSAESPLPPAVQRSLGDRSNEKRKNASLEIEALIKSLQQEGNDDVNIASMVHRVIAVLSKDFCTSMNSNYRKGGLLGLAATAIGLMQSSQNYLHVLLPPVLHCFDDPDSRVRYYACESLYNIAKASRQSILRYFNQIFEGLTKLYADVDAEVKNGANLLNSHMKDIVTEANSANSLKVEQFLPLLQKYIRRSNPFIRQLIVGWITLLDSVPDISMLDYLPDFLDGLFNMLSDSNREIQQAADSALSDFLRGVSFSTVMEFGPIVPILVYQCQSKERPNRLTAITWLAELIHHPYSGGDSLLQFISQILGAILWCISDGEMEIRLVAEGTNADFLKMVKETNGAFELRPLLETLIGELLNKEDVPTKMAALGWINMLLEKRKADMNEHLAELLPVLLRTLSDPSDDVVLSNLQVLSRISLAQRDRRGVAKVTEEAQFQQVLNAILDLFAKDRQLLETRGSLIIRKLCVLLNAQSVYIRLADALVKYETNNGKPANAATLEFVSTMVQTLNLILLTASELTDLRGNIGRSFVQPDDYRSKWSSSSPTASAGANVTTHDSNPKVFATLFRCWCHNPVATFSLCLLAHAYDLSFALVKRFSEMEDVSIGFLMQIDKLVYLIESPIFVHLRLQLLDVESKYHAPLLKSIYGILLCLPQGEAFRLLNNRLTTVCNLRESLGLSPMSSLADEEGAFKSGRRLPSLDKLLARFDEVVALRKVSRETARHLPKSGNGGVGADNIHFSASGTSSAGNTSVESAEQITMANGTGVRIHTSRSVDYSSPKRTSRPVDVQQSSRKGGR